MTCHFIQNRDTKYRAIQKKIPQHKNGDIYIAVDFLYQIFLVYSAYISAQLGLILLHLLNVCRSDAASE